MVPPPPGPAQPSSRLPISGTLLAADFIQQELPTLLERAGERAARAARRRLQAWWARASASLGPASGLHAIVDVGAVPLLRGLGYANVTLRRDVLAHHAAGTAEAGRGERLSVLVAPWGSDLDRAWRDAVTLGLVTGEPWCACLDGTRLRIIDTRRSWARRHVEIDLGPCALTDEGFAVLWSVTGPPAHARPSAGSPHPTRFDQLVERSARHAVRVCGSLQHGVHAALDLLVNEMGCTAARPRRGGEAHPVHEQALIVVFRLLFLLYAEARSLVPTWHPLYRDNYTIEALRDTLERARPARGVWEAIQAISRLAHAGCHVDTLAVTAFNGHLFAPEGAPLAEQIRLRDPVAQRMLLELTTRRSTRGSGRQRISYGDLGVEQLGAVYEHLLDRLPSGPARTARPGEPGTGSGVAGAGLPGVASRGRRSAKRRRARPGDSARKSTGTFYTPRSLTDYLVRRTLRPLVADATPAGVLRLRVLDPAMGSGAFLVAVCGYLASAYEAALVRAGEARPGDVSDADRTGFRRLVAQRCVFGVDLNPMAVHLARLSLWLTTLAADVPLTFLDHHLRVGDSLVGASPADLARQAPGPSRAGHASGSLPLFSADDLIETWQRAMPVRLALADQPDDTAAAVRAKSRLLDSLAASGGPLATWKQLGDAWCAAWFADEWPRGMRPAVFAALSDAIRGRACSLPARERDAWLDAVRTTAASRCFFHWSLEFPEVFVHPDGRPRDDAGFDAIVGNPPWDMVRGDAGAAEARASARERAARLSRFVRESGLYTGATDAHVNRYQLFTERALGLLRRGGRLGLVVPWSLFADHGSTALRRRLLERCRCDAIVSFENRRGLFPIHRSVRFALFTATTGEHTAVVRCRLGEDDPAALDRLPDAGGGEADYPLALSIDWLARTSRGALAFPAIRCAREVAIVDRLFAAGPLLGSDDGWGARFGRELNATDDRDILESAATAAGPNRRQAEGKVLPVVEGKHLAPFAVDLGRCTRVAPAALVSARLHADGAWQRRRLAYRDVASPGNRLTLIAARLPPQTVSTHTVFCLKTIVDDTAQAFLCGVMNSFVLNFLARLWVATHVTTSLVERLPVPKPPADDPLVVEIAGATRRLESRNGVSPGDGAILQAAVAALYRLTGDEFAAILETFPLIAPAERTAAIDAFRARGPRA